MKILPFLLGLMLWLSCQENTTQIPKEVVASSQRLDTLIKNKGIDTAALTAELVKAFSISEHIPNRQHDSLIAVVCRMKGLALGKLGKNKEALHYYEQGLSIGRRHLAITDDMMVRFYRNIGNYYYRIDDYPNALRYYDSVRIIRTDSASLALKIYNLNVSAICYQHIKDFESAERLMAEACSIAEKIYPPAEIAALYVEYAMILRSSKKYQQSIDQSAKGLDIFTTLNATTKLTERDSLYWANSYFYTAFGMKDLGLYKAAEPYYLRAIDVYKKSNNNDNYITGLMNLGTMYRIDKQLVKAEKVTNEGLSFLNKLPTLSAFFVLRKGELYINRSEIWMDKKEYAKALQDQDSAIALLTRYDENPSLHALLLNNRHNLLSVMSDKAKALLFLEQKNGKNKQNTEGSQKVLKLFEDITDLVEDMRVDLISEAAKISLADNAKGAFEKAIDLCFNLYQTHKDSVYLQQAFNFAEQSRSRNLLTDVQLNKHLPPDLQAENQAVKQMEAELLSTKANDIDYFQRYLQRKRQFREKIKNLSRREIATVQTLQNRLLTDNKTALIAYFMGDSSGYTFVLTPHHLSVHKLDSTRIIENLVIDFNAVITPKNKDTHKNSQQFLPLSSLIYDKILRGNIQELPNTTKRLIIIPDGVLNYLPFDILTNNSTAKTPDFRDIRYLLIDYTISYANSANVLLEQLQPKATKAPYIFAGFAPKYQPKDTVKLVVKSVVKDNSKDYLKDIVADLTREGLDELKGAADEVEAINELMDGEPFTQEAASESNFKKRAPQYRILHLAMHSLMDDDPQLSRLLFTANPKDRQEDNFLTIAELNTMNLNADLAVLSACNTGNGKLRRGEGVMSLSRAFTQAGVPSTVMSLWRVPDLTTKEIMVKFYKNLKDGKPKDEALRMAKLAYLKKAQESVAANPYYWAGFVPMGNMEAIHKEKTTNWGLIGSILGIVALGLAFFLKKIFSKKEVRNVK